MPLRSVVLGVWGRVLPALLVRASHVEDAVADRPVQPVEPRTDDRSTGPVGDELDHCLA